MSYFRWVLRGDLTEETYEQRSWKYLQKYSPKKSGQLEGQSSWGGDVPGDLWMSQESVWEDSGRSWALGRLWVIHFEEDPSFCISVIPSSMAHKQSPKSSFWRIFSEGAILLGLVSMPHQECPESVRSFWWVLYQSGFHCTQILESYNDQVYIVRTQQIQIIWSMHE